MNNIDQKPELPNARKQPFYISLSLSTVFVLSIAFVVYIIAIREPASSVPASAGSAKQFLIDTNPQKASV